MKTIKTIRKQALRIITIGFILLFVILILQSFSGKFGTQIYIPWLWLIILYSAPFITLFQAKETQKKVSSSVIITFTFLFVICTILIIFLLPVITKNQGWSFSYSLKLSFLFLIPLELFLIYLYRKRLYMKKGTVENESALNPDPKVFISYNHGDSAVAIKIRDSITKLGIPVIIDRDNMKAGENINDFIQNSLKESNILVAVVSNKSLKSAWVAKESLDSIFLTNYYENKKFIACYIDDDFFHNEYTINTVNIISKQLIEIQDLIEKHHDLGIDTRDLNNQKSRLMSLRNGLDGIIGRLRGSLCLDVREESFDGSMDKLINAIQDDL